MPHRVEIISQERILEGFFQIQQARIRYERYDGRMSAPMTRLVLERGDAAAVLPYDRERREVLLIQQFRYPAHVRGGPGWLWEIVAGMLQQGEAPEDVVRREALEEAGYRLAELEFAMTVYLTPGGSSEHLHLFIAPVTPAQRVQPGGGLVAEGEDILVRMFPFEEALHMIEDGRIMDAKTVLALQYLSCHHTEFRTAATGD